MTRTLSRNDRLPSVRTDEVMTLMQDVAARVINPRFRALADGQVSEKQPGDLVTIADREAEELLTEALLRAAPGAVVLGEEAASADPSLLETYAEADHAFTVDPVDGTRNFVHGSPDHAVMLSERRAGEVVRAWIWQPQHRRGYVAERGGGTWRDGERLTRVAPGGDPHGWRGVTSRRSWVGWAPPGLRALELTWVSCGIDYPKLIEGYADFVLYRHSKPWDHAPASLLLGEVGGVVERVEGGTYDCARECGPLLSAVSPEIAATVRRAVATA